MEYTDQQQRMEAGFNHIRQELENVDTDPPSYPFPAQDAENYNWPFLQKNQLSPTLLCKKQRKLPLTILPIFRKSMCKLTFFTFQRNESELKYDLHSSLYSALYESYWKMMKFPSKWNLTYLSEITNSYLRVILSLVFDFSTFRLGQRGEI